MASEMQLKPPDIDKINSNTTQLSIVLLTWNSERYIQRCIESIILNLSDIDYKWEAIIVDNGSQDGTVSFLKKLSLDNPDLFFIHLLSSNCGTTVSRNIALGKAKGKFIAIVDSDIEFTGNIFTPLMEILETDDSIGLITPKIFYPSGRWQKSYDKFPTIFQKINRFFRLKTIENREQSEKTNNGLKYVDYAISAFWLFRRTLLDKVGLLDEKIFYSPEDVDYCLRVWKAGYSIIHNADCSVIHHCQEISRGWKINKAKFHHMAGLCYFLLKHRYFFNAPVFAKKNITHTL